MKPTPIEALACGNCGALYRTHDIGKQAADACCACRTCGAPSATYTGQGGVCTKCLTIEALRTARKAHEVTARDLNEIEERAQALGIAQA